MILNSAERMLARRYLLPGKGEGFIFLVASISLVAVALGVAALIIVMSVMNGFRAELLDKIVGLNGHAVVQGYDGHLSDWRQISVDAKATPGVVSALPIVEQPLMAASNGRVDAAIVRGMRWNDVLDNKTITGNIKSGDIRSIAPGSGRIAIGSGLARSLGAYPGTQISLISPEGRSTVVGTVPRIVSFTVGAVYEIGVWEYDKAFVLMPLEDAQTFLLMGDNVGMVEIQTEDAEKVGTILAPLAPKVAREGVIIDWRQLNGALFSALEVERVAMFVILSLIVLVAVFNILSSLIMLVRAKTRDIAILRTMGASRSGMVKVFVTVGTTIGGLGILAGMILAPIFLYFRQGIVDGIQRLSGVDLWDPSVRVLTQLPSRTDPIEVFVIAATAFVLSFLATLYPAFKAASTDPVQVLRYE